MNYGIPGLESKEIQSINTKPILLWGIKLILDLLYVFREFRLNLSFYAITNKIDILFHKS